MNAMVGIVARLNLLPLALKPFDGGDGKMQGGVLVAGEKLLSLVSDLGSTN